MNISSNFVAETSKHIVMEIKELLKEKGILQKDVAQKMGIAKENFNKMLKNPTETTVRKISDAIGIEPWELFAPADVRHRANSATTFACPKCGHPIKVTLSDASNGE